MFLKYLAANAHVFDVWMQACPCVCSENTHGCVCTQRLTSGALVTWLHGAHETWAGTDVGAYMLMHTQVPMSTFQLAH